MPEETTQRLQWLLHFAEHGSASATCAQFGISRNTFYRWLNRFDPNDLNSLTDHPTRLTPSPAPLPRIGGGVGGGGKCPLCRLTHWLRAPSLRSVCTLVLVTVILNIALLLLVLPVAAGATGTSSWNPGLLVNTEAFQTIDDADTTANVRLKFGETLQESLTYNRTTSQFEFTRSLKVGGNLTATGALHITGTIAGSGTLAIEGNAALGGTVKLNGVTYTFPTSDGTASGKVLKTDSAGTLSWSTDNDVSGITAPVAEGMFVNQGGDTMSGALTIKKNSGTATGNTLVVDTNGLVYDATNKRVGVGTASPTSGLDIEGSTGITWQGAEGESSGLVTVGSPGVGGSLFIHTPSYTGNGTATFNSGLGVDGTYANGKSVVNLKAYGTKSGGTYNGEIAFHTSDQTTLTERMRITNGGNVGIGTTTPNAKLSVAGTASGRILSFGDRLTGSGNVSIRTLTDSTTAFQVLDSDGGDPVFNIDTTNERVGIGTADPLSKLHVNAQTAADTSNALHNYPASFFGTYNPGNLGTSLFLGSRNALAADVGGAVTFGGNSGDNRVYPFGQILGAKETGGSDYAGYIAISTIASNSAMNERLRITSTGNVGIGTTAPETKLEVTGTASGDLLHAQKDLSSSGTLAIEGNAAFGGTIKLNDINYTFPASDGTASGKVLKTNAAGQLSWSTDNDTGASGLTAPVAEGMFVNQGGDTMTGALAIRPATAGEAALEVAGTASGRILSFGTRLTGSGAVSIRTLTDSVTAFQVMDSDGGNPVFNIDTTNERVGIGTAAPTAKLHVTDGLVKIGTDTSDPTTGVQIATAPAIGYGQLGVFDTTAAALDVGGDVRLGGLYDGTHYTTWSNVKGAKETATSGEYGGALTFGTRANGGAITEKMRITSTGNVGIGTATPNVRLSVAGTASGKILSFGTRLTGSGAVSIRTLLDSTTAFQVLDSDGGTPVFNIDTTNERVGIGTASPSAKLTVGDGTASTQVTILGSTDADKAPALVLGRNTGWFISKGGTTVNDLSFSYEMASYSDADIAAAAKFVIKSDGKVGIGTTAPETTLEVTGTMSGAALQANNINGSASAATGSIMVGQAAGAPIWKAPTSAMVWYVDGAVATGTKQSATVVMPYGFTCTDIDMRVDTAPVGSSLIVDINKDGTTIFSTRPEIDAAATSEDGNHAFSVTDLPAGSVITIDVDQVGSGTAGSDLTVILKGTRKY